MRYSLKRMIQNAVTLMELGYRVVRGVDYQTLSQYILKINKHRDIDAILLEVSQCLKEILDYELFGFAMKNGNTLELWIDPRMYNARLRDYVVQDHKGQNIDCVVHNFEAGTTEHRHISDVSDINNLISYRVIDGAYSAKMYILPRKKMLYHHDAIVNMIINSISIALEKNLSIQQLENAAAVDPLTHCYNRRALDTFIENDIAFSKRHGVEMSIILLDIDNFKSINDHFGHQAGDEVLREIAALIPQHVRKSDYIARYGGEEFIVVLPDSTLYNAVQIAHKVRKLIERHTIRYNGSKISVTASFGVASLEQKHDHVELFHEADERLYQSKAMGKNLVVPSLMPCFADRSFVLKKNKLALSGAIRTA